ncbi:hypothetical protein EV650_3019 [Kribbella kalugense]|uniref:Uncharacterized protein n=2 Tax=Kribbella kalugense TaxID=2512221 RepID=A0A4R8A0Y5_9ACTN|nr:hypothetical protein EV650_3019 [Kribbella kalugense]
MSGKLADRVAAVAGLDRPSIVAASPDVLERTLESLLGALKRLSDSELQQRERHQDGSLRITSHLAVWLISRVAEAYGNKLVDLAKVPDKQSLRSLAGLAHLLHSAIDEKEGRQP